MIGIDLRNSAELRAIFLAMRNAGPDIAKWIRLSIKTVTLPEWVGVLRNSGATPAQSAALVETAKVAVSNQNIRLSAGNAARKLSGGGKARELAHGLEFGGGDNTTNSYPSRSRRGRSYIIHNRHTTRQFPARNRKGYVVYPAAAKIIPRIASLAVQTTIRTILDLIDGKGA